MREGLEKEQVDILKEVFTEWLQIHDLDYDFWVYSGNEWSKRCEGVLKDAIVVIAFENQLVNLLNYSESWDVEEELQDLAAGFGFYFEMGNHWNIGFYPLTDAERIPSGSQTYSKLLTHSNWKAKRQRIISRSAGRCEQCEKDTKSLEVHHCYYRYGRLPWQYPDGSLLALCRNCHNLRGKTELRFRMFMTNLKVDDLEQIRERHTGM